MDDTARRVNPTPRDFRGQAEEEIVVGSDETVRNYSSADAAARTDAVDSDVTARTTQIRGEIEQTREEMTETIEAIQEKLRPSNIVANATDRVKQATTEGVRNMADMASDTANDMMDYGREAYGSIAGEVRQNPIPLALLGIGAAWLLMGHNTGSRGRDRHEEGLWRRANRDQQPGPGYRSAEDDVRGRQDYSERYDNVGGLVDTLTSHPVQTALAAMGIAFYAMSERGGNGAKHVWSQSGRLSEEQWRRQYRAAKGEGATGTTGTPGTTGTTGTAGVYESVKESAQGVASTAQQYASEAGDYASEALETVQQRGRQAQNELQRMMHENPLLVGVGALAIGAMIGMALPETERENEWMGEARDTVVERAETMARDAASKVQDAAGEVANRVVSGK